ncbi:MAG: HAMP domain-containing sensor histidine kinase [Caulobacteraceae bacterium]
MQRQQSYLMASAGHDLKQPLQVILMVMNRLMPQLPPKDLRYAEIALAEIGQLGKGLSELAVAAQFAPEAAGPCARPTTFALGEVIEPVVASWQFHAAIKGLPLRSAASNGTIYSDPALVATVLRNLIGNAIKYTDSGSVFVCCRRRRTTVRIEVWDSGPGIDVGQLRQIMEPFHQGDSSRGGLGLGLAIARHAAEVLGGSIEVDTFPGRGSRFTLCLPRAIRGATANREGEAGLLARAIPHQVGPQTEPAQAHPTG